MRLSDKHGFIGTCPKCNDGRVEEHMAWRVSRDTFKAKVSCDECDYHETLQRAE